MPSLHGSGRVIPCDPFAMTPPEDSPASSAATGDQNQVAAGTSPVEQGPPLSFRGLLGRKIGMTQIFDAESGRVVPVTVIEAGPCPVLTIRSAERDGYEAVQIGFKDRPRRLASRSVRGQVAALEGRRAKRRVEAGVATLPKAGCEPQRFVREFRGPSEGLEVGQVLTVAVFNGVSSVDVTGTTKGRGTAGVMKRHGFKGQRATHGVKKVHRHAGGTSMNTSPARVFKGKKMAGRHGNERSTMRNLRVVGVDGGSNLLLVRGAVPGPRGSFLIIRRTNMLRKIGGGPSPTTKKKKAGGK
jgi:large subunit ribosomal protein L3